MKWVGLVLLVILLLLVMGALVQLVRWAQARESDPEATFILPRVQVVRLNIEQLDPDTTRLNLILAIDYPAPIGFTMDSLDHVMSIAGNEVARSTYPYAIAIKANDSARIELPIMVLTERLRQVLEQLEATGVDSVEYAMEANFHVSAAFWKDKPMRVRIARQLPLFLIPKVDLRDPVLEKLGLGESRVTIDVALFNPNVFGFAFRQTDFTARINDHDVLATTIDTLVRIPANDTVIMRMPLRMAAGRLVVGLFDLLVKPSRTPYSYRMALTIVSDDATINNCRSVVAGDGTLDELKAVRKSGKARNEEGGDQEQL